MVARAYADAAQPREDWRFMWGWKMEARNPGIGYVLVAYPGAAEIMLLSLHKHRAFLSRKRGFSV